MKVFASHSQHMQNSWAKCGPPDAPEFYATGHQAILDTKDGKTVDFTDLDNYINEMEKGIQDQQTIKQQFEEKTNKSKQKLYISETVKK